MSELENEDIVLSTCPFCHLIQVGLLPSNLDNQIDLIVFFLLGSTECSSNWKRWLTDMIVFLPKSTVLPKC